MAGKEAKSDIFENVNPVIREAVGQKLIDELIFMRDLLEKLKEKIHENGVVINADGTLKESPAVKSYNQTVQRYTLGLKQLEMILRNDIIIVEGESALQAWLEASKS